MLPSHITTETADAAELFEMFRAIRKCSRPVLARVNGAALGGGSGLVAAVDIAIAEKKAKFGFTEVKLGLIPAVISPYVMQKIGNTHASRYFLTGERFDADKAETIGLVHDVGDGLDKVDEKLEEILMHIVSNGPNAVKAAKTLISNVQDLPGKITSTLAKQLVASEIAKLRVSEEGQEGLQAFFDKRKPKWTE